MWLKRAAARVVLLDREGRIFLVNAEDPIDPFKPAWWEIPGGGIGDLEMGPVIWTQHVQFDFGGYHFDSDEKIHVAWCDGGEYRPQHLEALEAAAFLGARWWALDELLASDEPVLPTLLREHLPPIVAGVLPDVPIDISPVPLD
jgi:8-oxo-dGTP pyrophosphatase MutT (NUDIX family)